MAMTITAVATTIAAIAMAATIFATTFAAFNTTLTATITTTINATIKATIKTIRCALFLRFIRRRAKDRRHNRENRAGQGAQEHQIEAHAPTILPRFEPGRGGRNQKHDSEGGNKSQIGLQPRALRAGALFLTHHPYGEGDGVLH